jgi:hypothetical protein
MNAMALFGWVVLALATGYATFVTIAGWICCRAWTGKTEGGVYIFALIAGVLWYILYTTCPFTVVIQ